MTEASALHLTPDTGPISGGSCSGQSRLAVGRPPGSLLQAHFESDSSVVEIRNNAILQENRSLPAHINDSSSNFAKDYVLCVPGEPTQPENPSIFLENGVCNQSSILEKM